MTEIIKALVVDEQSRQSYNLVSLFSSLQHCINQFLKLLKEKREKTKKKKTKTNRPHFSSSFEVDVDLENYVMEIFVYLKLNLLKTTVKTAVKPFTPV